MYFSVLLLVIARLFVRNIRIDVCICLISFLYMLIFVGARICAYDYLSMCVHLCAHIFYVIICGLQDLCELFILSSFSLKSNRQINSLKYESYVPLMSIKHAVNRKSGQRFHICHINPFNVYGSYISN